MKQFCQVRIRDIVEDHEAGVNMDIGTLFFQRDSVGVPAYVVVLFIKTEMVVGEQEMAAAHSGNAGSDDSGGHIEELKCSRKRKTV